MFGKVKTIGNLNYYPDTIELLDTSSDSLARLPIGRGYLAVAETDDTSQSNIYRHLVYAMGNVHITKDLFLDNGVNLPDIFQGILEGATQEVSGGVFLMICDIDEENHVINHTREIMEHLETDFSNQIPVPSDLITSWYFEYARQHFTHPMYSQVSEDFSIYENFYNVKSLLSDPNYLSLFAGYSENMLTRYHLEKRNDNLGQTWFAVERYAEYFNMPFISMYYLFKIWYGIRDAFKSYLEDQSSQNLSEEGRNTYINLLNYMNDIIPFS